MYWYERISHHSSRNIDKINWNRSDRRLNINTVFPRYGDSHVKDKTVARPSDL